MSAPKRKNSPLQNELSFDEDDDIDYNLELEGSSSDFNELELSLDEYSDNSYDDIVLPTDWAMSGRERNPFTFRSPKFIKFHTKPITFCWYKLYP